MTVNVADELFIFLQIFPRVVSFLLSISLSVILNVHLSAVEFVAALTAFAVEAKTAVLVLHFLRLT